MLLQTPNYITFGALTSTQVFPGVGSGNSAPPSPWSNGGLTGVIDDARFFNITLTPTDVQDLFLLGSHGQ